MNKHVLPVMAVLLTSMTTVSSGSTTLPDQTGYVVDTNASYASVGAIIGQNADGAYLCSGTLINPNWVLTAAHCVDDATAISFGTGLNMSTVSLYGEVLATSWLPHPDWTGALSKGNDIGLIQLSSSITGIATPELYTASDERGLVGTSVGFGYTGQGDKQGMENRFLDGSKRINQNNIDVHFSTPGKTNKYFGMDFDSPAGTDSSWGGTLPTSLEGGTLFGDSGGPVFVGGKLAGVNSFISASDGNADADYGDRSGHIRVSLYVDWINTTTGDSGGGDGGGDGGGESGGGGGRPPWAGGGKGSGLVTLDADEILNLRELVGSVPSTSHAASVPEPSTTVLLALGTLTVVCRYRQGSSRPGRVTKCDPAGRPPGSSPWKVDVVA